MVQIGILTDYEGLNGAPVVGVGGTSASSPSFGGIISLLNDINLADNKSPLRFLNPLLYKVAAQNPKTFNDVIPQIQNINGTVFVEGANTACTRGYCCEYGFPIAAGWDAGTGLGTINFLEFQKTLDQIFKSKNKVAIN